METKTITINGHTFAVRAGMPASEFKALAGIRPERALIARTTDGAFELVPDYRPLPGPPVIDVPRFIYG